MQYIIKEIVERDGKEIYNQELTFKNKQEMEEMILKLKAEFNQQRLIAVINGNGVANIGLTQRIERKVVK